MDSGFDDWVYWHLFTITLNYNSSHIEILLNDVCLTNLYKESLKNFPRLKSPGLNQISIIISDGSLIPLLLVSSVATKRSSLLLSNRSPIVDCVTSKVCLPKRCLAKHFRSPFFSSHVTALCRLNCRQTLPRHFLNQFSYNISKDVIAQICISRLLL
jgi:hypothetical protein